MRRDLSDYLIILYIPGATELFYVIVIYSLVTFGYGGENGFTDGTLVNLGGELNSINLILKFMHSRVLYKLFG